MILDILGLLRFPKPIGIIRPPAVSRFAHCNGHGLEGKGHAVNEIITR